MNLLQAFIIKIQYSQLEYSEDYNLIAPRRCRKTCKKLKTTSLPCFYSHRIAEKYGSDKIKSRHDSCSLSQKKNQGSIGPTRQ